MDKKDKKEEDLKNIKEPVFNIHKMPKGYKTGRFDLNHHTKKEKNPENNNNELGFLLLAWGPLLLWFYFIWFFPI